MLPPKSLGNQNVAKGVASLFGSEEDSDCVVVFCVKSNSLFDTTAATSTTDGPSKRQRLADGTSVTSQGGRGDYILVGDPLPGHQLVLRFASERFSAQLKRWDTRRSRGLPGSAAEPIAHAPACSDGRPVLRVVLASESDEPSARIAIRYAYTGDVQVGSIREALQVRRQAVSLRIQGCAAACMEHLRAKLAAAPPSAVTTSGSARPAGRDGSDVQKSATDLRGSSGSGRHAATPGGCKAAAAACALGGGAGAGADPDTSVHEAPPPPVLELFYCQRLWPDPAEEVPEEDSAAGATAVAGRGCGFTALVAAAKPQLVAHFGDVLRTLNSRTLRQQLLRLPAVALEALLESDDLATDCESSVLLLLATWMEANFAATDEPTRQRLCSHVRLVQLSRPYLCSVLPVLALDYETARAAGAATAAAPAPGAPAAVTGAASALTASTVATPKASTATLAAAAPLPSPTPSRAAWFPISGTEAAFITGLATAAPPLREALAAAGRKLYDTASSQWYSTRPRRQALPAASGRVHRWVVPAAQLARSLEALAPGGVCCTAATFEGDLSCISAAGFEWWPSLECRHGAAVANLGLYSQIPEALAVPGSRFAGEGGASGGGGGPCGGGGGGGGSSRVVAVAGLDADLSVHRFQGERGPAVDDGVSFGGADVWPVGGGRGANVIVLGQRGRASGGGGVAGAGPGDEAVAAGAAAIIAAAAAAAGRRSISAGGIGGQGCSGSSGAAAAVLPAGGNRFGSAGGAVAVCGGTPIQASRTGAAGGSGRQVASTGAAAGACNPGAGKAGIGSAPAPAASGGPGPGPALPAALAGWSAYVRDGRVTGTLTLLRPSPP